MPQMGESIAEGTVSTWLKKVGDQVERDEPIMEISTDKVDAEIPSPAAGTLAEIVVQEGDTVEVGTVVAYLETSVTARQASAGTPAPEPEPGTPEEEPATPVAGEAEPKAERDSSVATVPPGAGNGGGPETLEERLRRRSSPLVRRIAAEHDVDISAIDGSGRHGRVTKGDILSFIERGVPAGRGPAPAGGVSWDAFYTRVEHPEVTAGPGDRVEPVPRMTSLIADHMILSRRTSAHVHSYFEVDYSQVDRVRANNRRVWEEQGVKVTYTGFIAKAVATALREHPKLNAALSRSEVIYRGDVNLGVAVALEQGLIVPVVRKADQLSLAGLSQAIADLAERARSKKLKPEEVQDGTFTITNPGVFGTRIGFPIINQPQVAIMGVGAVEKRPVVISDEFGNDAIVPRRRGFLSLGYDHRLVNGADADRFLARVKEILENFPEAGA